MRLRFLPQWLLILLCVFSFFKTVDAAIVDDAYIHSLIQPSIQQAEDLQLAQHETWLALLHYKRETVLRQFVSQVDDAAFFLDKNGNTDAHAELVADIQAFLQPPGEGHAQCLFPARWWWLKQQLALPGNLDVPCARLHAFMEKVSHQKLFLAFPSMYLKNPGSTFGHTFLRFDGDGESILLSQTLNYAARVDKSDNLVSYIGKGLSGGYRGFFRVRPYSETVQEYNNIENRDIWEYQLAFTPAEIEQLVRHLWEVKGIDFDYYFFRENCAYRLLALLDVIRPGMQLTGENNFPVYAIPVDTVRVLDDTGLLESRTFRASLATKINDSFSSDYEASTVALKIVSDDTVADKDEIRRQLSSLGSDSQKREALQLSFDILQFKNKADSSKTQSVLQITDEISVPVGMDEDIENDVKRISPEKGHDSIRVAGGYGQQDSQQYIDIRFRPAFHDLLDAPQGYVNGAAINVLDTHIKWFTHNDDAPGKLRLESLSLFNVTSLSPLQRWEKPLSWLLDFRFDRTQMSATKSVSNFISRGGAGFSVNQQGLTSSVLLMGEWNLSSAYDKGYSVLLGLQAGIHYNFAASQVMLSYEKDAAVSGFDLDRSISQFQWQYNLQVNHALRALYRRTKYDFYNDEDWSLSYYYYF